MRRALYCCATTAAWHLRVQIWFQHGPDGQADDLCADEGGHGRAEHGKSGSNEEDLDRVSWFITISNSISSKAFEAFASESALFPLSVCKGCKVASSGLSRPNKTRLFCIVNKYFLKTYGQILCGKNWTQARPNDSVSSIASHHDVVGSIPATSSREAAVKNWPTAAKVAAEKLSSGFKNFQTIKEKSQ